MKINFPKKYLYCIIGLLIVSGFFWIGYQGSQKEEQSKEEESKEEDQTLIVSSERSKTYPNGIIEGEVLSVSSEKIEIMADLTKMYPQEESLTKKIEIIIEDQTKLTKIYTGPDNSSESTATIRDFLPENSSGPILARIKEDNTNILSEGVFTAIEIIVFQ